MEKCKIMELGLKERLAYLNRVGEAKVLTLVLSTYTELLISTVYESLSTS